MQPAAAALERSLVHRRRTRRHALQNVAAGFAEHPSLRETAISKPRFNAHVAAFGYRHNHGRCGG